MRKKKSNFLYFLVSEIGFYAWFIFTQWNIFTSNRKGLFKTNLWGRKLLPRLWVSLDIWVLFSRGSVEGAVTSVKRLSFAHENDFAFKPQAEKRKHQHSVRGGCCVRGGCSSHSKQQTAASLPESRLFTCSFTWVTSEQQNQGWVSNSFSLFLRHSHIVRCLLSELELLWR